MKKFLFLIIGIVIIYMFSFLFLGKSAICQQLVLDNNTTFNSYKWTNNVKIVSPLNCGELASIFNIDNTHVEFTRIESWLDFDSFQHQDSSYYYLINIDSFFPVLYVEEIEKAEEYFQSWEKRYVWCFYKWIKVRDVGTGIS
jgi:hypothetical protein